MQAKENLKARFNLMKQGGHFGYEVEPIDQFGNNQN